jgi:pullulanase
MTSEKMIQEHLEFLSLDSPLLVGYTLKNNANGDTWKNIRVYFSGDDKDSTQTIEGSWKLVCNGTITDEKGIGSIQTKTIVIPSRSAVILYQE